MAPPGLYSGTSTLALVARASAFGLGLIYGNVKLKALKVIVEKAENSEIPNIDKKEYLVPSDLTVDQFVYVIGKRIKLSAERAIFIFVDNVLPPTKELMSSVYEDKKDEDGL